MRKLPAISFLTGDRRPLWRGRIHTWAFALSIPAVVTLVVLAVDLPSKVAAAVFGLSLATVYGVSAAYHRLATTARAQRIMRRLDHSMIFVLIAGTYTPVCLIALPAGWRYPLLGLIWALAAFGIAIKAWGTDAILNAGNGLYLVMGWLVIVAMPVMLRTLSPWVLTLMVLGGLLYTVGAVMFFFRRPRLRPEVFGYHEVWHAFTVLAGASHFAMVALVVSQPVTG